MCIYIHIFDRSLSKRKTHIFTAHCVALLGYNSTCEESVLDLQYTENMRKMCIENYRTFKSHHVVQLGHGRICEESVLHLQCIQTWGECDLNIFILSQVIMWCICATYIYVYISMYLIRTYRKDPRTQNERPAQVIMWCNWGIHIESVKNLF